MTRRTRPTKPLTAAEVEVLRIADGLTGAEAKQYLMHLFCSGHFKLAKGNMTRAGEHSGMDRDNVRKHVNFRFPEKGRSRAK